MAKNTQLEALQNSRIGQVANNGLGLITRNPDIVLAIGILLILCLLIVPLPTILLDLFLAISIALSVLILMVSIYLVKPLDFSSFPTILLITTLFRLGLNVATTRLILGEGHAGDIIEAFGNFVISGNYIVGFIIFVILLVINFVVVIKGSTRIAEVAARFTLDALPGKQMSIDADLNAGFIDEQTARKRREELTRESDFYGSMDGAAKFIRGDAIAALIITGVNLIGGFAIGMLQKNLSFLDALSTYTIMTIGDGLVSQIPALLVSVAGGLVVTRSGASEKLESELGKQFGTKPKPLYLAAGALGILAVLPGFPALPFLILSVSIGLVGYVRTIGIKKESEQELRKELAAAEAERTQEPKEQPVEELLRIDPIEIEIGYSLISLVDETQGGDVFKRITNVRKQLATELGYKIPLIRVRDNLQLEPEKYVIKIRGNEIASNVLHPNMLLAMNPGNAEGELNGIKVTEPVFGLPATWISVHERENAEILGYTVVEAGTVLTTHLTELLRRNAYKLLTRQDMKDLIENLKTDYPVLVEEITPDKLPISVAQKVCQNLLAEGIPLKDLAKIIEALLDYYKATQNIDVLTEYVRHNLSDLIKSLYEDNNEIIHAIAIEPNLEDHITNALSANNAGGVSLTMGLAPDVVRGIRNSLAEAIDEVTIAGHMPIVICSAQVRPFFYRMIHSTYPMVSVISYTEIPSDSEVEIITSIKVDE
jgi:flagellar biosynthesis protein FlhA